MNLRAAWKANLTVVVDLDRERGTGGGRDPSRRYRLRKDEFLFPIPPASGLMIDRLIPENREAWARVTGVVYNVISGELEVVSKMLFPATEKDNFFKAVDSLLAQEFYHRDV